MSTDFVRRLLAVWQCATCEAVAVHACKVYRLLEVSRLRPWTSIVAYPTAGMQAVSVQLQELAF
jgi:hypothetical protein